MSTIVAVVPFDAVALSGVTLYPTVSEDELTIGDVFTAAIVVDTVGNDLNAFEVSVSYPGHKLQVQELQTENSVCTIWVFDPSFDNEEGVAHFMCGTPDNYNGNAGLIGEIVFEAIKVGEAQIIIEQPSQALAADGYGTEMLEDMLNVHVHVSDMVIEETLVSGESEISSESIAPQVSQSYDVSETQLEPNTYLALQTTVQYIDGGE